MENRRHSGEPKGITQQAELYSPSGDVTCSSWSKNGKYIALGTSSSKVLIWEEPALSASTAKFKASIKPFSNLVEGSYNDKPIVHIEWSPDGKSLLCLLADGSLCLYNLNSKASRLLTQGDPITYSFFSWSPDSKHIALARSGAISIVNALGAVVRQTSIRDYCAVAWSPDGHFIGAGTGKGQVVLLDGHSGIELSVCGSHSDRVAHLSWSSDGMCLASCSNDASVRLWDAKNVARNRVLEGHTSSVTQCCFSADGLFLASVSEDSLRVWLRATGEQVAQIPQPSSRRRHAPLSFHPVRPLLATHAKTKTSCCVWALHAPILFTSSISRPFTKHISAKIVVVGESSVGKSCLSARIATDSYAERGTTHGMQFWPILPERFDPKHICPPDEKQQIVLWDMGGQDQYRLIHQLFLHDTTVALILVEPTRGRAAFEDVKVWNKRLEKQLRGRSVAKFLVGTKLESDDAVVDLRAIDDLISSCGFRGYFPTSAKTGKGVDELSTAIASALDWKKLAETTRPQVFQQIREEIEQQWRAGKVVLLFEDLLEQIKLKSLGDYSERAVDRVVKQLAQLGVLVESSLSTGERALVLQINEVERYAGSIILLAHQHPQGIAAIEESRIASTSMSFPGIAESERLPRDQELVVLQCVVRLLLEHGICLSHKGLLVFPSLIQVAASSGIGSEVQHSVSLYYDFSGAIDNIYSALVVSLAYSGDFGAMRLWSDRAEFEQNGNVVYGLKQVPRDGGFAHLDVYFSDEVKPEERSLFNSFIEQHLQENGVDIREHVEVSCSQCGTVINERVIRARILDNKSDVGCPKCDIRIKISEGAVVARENDQFLVKRTWALKTRIENRKEGIAHSSERLFRSTGMVDPRQPIRILHLSDLHMREDSDPSTMSLQLIKDLRGDVDGLGIDELDYLVISGDLTNRGAREGYSKALKFVEEFLSEFPRLTPERCIIVPGNHDVDRKVPVYDWIEGRSNNDTKHLPSGSYVEQPDVLGCRNDAKYPERFRLFSDLFFHPASLMPYPSNPDEQVVSYFYPSDYIQVLAINSACMIDRFFPERAAVLAKAVTAGISRGDKQIEQARSSRRIDPERPILRLAVWHHPVSGQEAIKDSAFVHRLIQSGVRIGMHGHIHEDLTTLFAYMASGEMHICGAGSFGAVGSDRPEGTPRLYNLLEIDRKFSKLRVYTRALDHRSQCWGAYAKWPGSRQHERRAYYEVSFRKLGRARGGFV
ncbi:MAG: metallophosphoesterase [Fimbriimonas sp.]